MKIKELTPEQRAKRNEYHKKWRNTHFLERREYMREYMQRYVRSDEGRVKAKKAEAAYRERQRAFKAKLKELRNAGE